MHKKSPKKGLKLILSDSWVSQGLVLTPLPRSPQGSDCRVKGESLV
jgi:hypothetical protein